MFLVRFEEETLIVPPVWNFFLFVYIKLKTVRNTKDYSKMLTKVSIDNFDPKTRDLFLSYMNQGFSYKTVSKSLQVCSHCVFTVEKNEKLCFIVHVSFPNIHFTYNN